MYLKSINALKSSRFMSIVAIRLSADDFKKIVEKLKEPIVLHSITSKGLLSKEVSHEYLVFKGCMAFYCSSDVELELPGNPLVVDVESMPIPLP